jgi:CheY-like chemotaxis protein
MTARVLVVDDIATNLRLLEAKLLNEYYEVSVAASGVEALAVVQRWMPDVVLLDVMMPEMDGYEVCRRLKAQPATAHIPVVMITALTDQAESRARPRAGRTTSCRTVERRDACSPPARPAAHEAVARRLAAPRRDRPATSASSRRPAPRHRRPVKGRWW